MTPVGKLITIGAVIIITLIILIIFWSASTTVNVPVTISTVPKFDHKYTYNYAFGVDPGMDGGGGNITYLGKAVGMEACEAKCAENSWCNAYTSFNSGAPYTNDCFGMRTVPNIPGQNYSGNGGAVSGIKL